MAANRDNALRTDLQNAQKNAHRKRR